MDIRYAKILKWIHTNHPDQLNRWIESVSPNQIKCKQWLTSELKPIIKKYGQYWPESNYTTEIIGGWFGWPLLDYISDIPLGTVRLVDIDSFCSQVSHKYCEIFKPGFNFKFINEDIMDISENNDTRKTRLVINTSCEHMADMSDIIISRGYNTEKIMVVLQSNNKIDEPDHINCVNSWKELAEQSGVVNVYYGGELNMGSYTRYMVIGRLHAY